ncbi:MAG: 2-hydroxyacyl-CoA dehydratase [Dehalococcoidia bacterium]|nr:2-hydroxyacyl-CoA dehydratase [Dehalococcoidia bacterium]
MKPLRNKTKPLDCWQKGKELRLQFYKDVSSAKEQGKFIVSGAVETGVLPAGFKDCLFMASEPYGASIAYDPIFAQQCVEATEARGFARDMCSYMRNYWGSLFLDRYYFGGRFPRPDLYLSIHSCDTHAKWYQALNYFCGIPFFIIEIPPTFNTKERFQNRVEYLAGLTYDAIEWMEKTTGKEYDDERFIQALYYEYEAESMWSEVCMMNQTIPAPLDQKSMWTLFVIDAILKGTKENLDFYRILRDEVKERVTEGIGALPFENCRLLFEGQPPWFFLKLFRIIEQYGAVCVASHYGFTLSGHFTIDQDGKWDVPKPLKQRGINLKNREAAVRFYAEEELSKPMFDIFYSPFAKNSHILQLAKQWHTQGVIMHLNRGCEGLAQFQLENRLMLVRENIPVVTLEGNMADWREWDEAQVIDRLESFMESLGLHKTKL